MLRAMFVGAVAAMIGSRVAKANREGRLEDTKTRIKDRVANLRNDLSRGNRLSSAGTSNTSELRSPRKPPRAARSARVSPTDEVSRPAKSAPWPADARAAPQGG